jgi:hypothetical protein
LYEIQERILGNKTRNRRQDEVREDGRIVGGEGWHEKVYNREEWKKLLRTARNRRIVQVPTERTNEQTNKQRIAWYRLKLGHTTALLQT